MLFGLVAGIVIGITFTNMSGIGQAAEGGAVSENPLTSWVPDFKEIFTGAIEDMFSSASGEIQDPEIADFYSRLTSNMMATVDQDDVKAYSGPVIEFPVVRIASPANDSVVSGLVHIQVDAVDDLDPAGSLSVEITVDGATRLTATFSPNSGYYETSWDTVAVLPYTMHTLTAVVIDMQGNSQSALTVVLVEPQAE